MRPATPPMTYIFIREDTSPQLVLAGRKAPLPWHAGSVHAMQQAARFVRLNARGVLFAGGLRGQDGLRKLDGGAWHTLPCYASEEALCAGENIVLFPTQRADVPYADAQYDANQFFRDGGRPCAGTAWAGGHLTGAGRIVNGSDTRYEVTVCDLFDGGLDVVYEPDAGVVRWRYDTRGAAGYVFLALAGIFFASVLCGNITAVLENQKLSATFAHVAVAVTLLVLLFTDGFTPDTLVTENDLFAWRLLWIFAALECVIQLAKDRLRFTRAAASIGISLFTATLMLLATAAHASFDNPYLPPLLTLLGVRTWWKQLRGIARATSLLGAALLLLDGLAYALVVGAATPALGLAVLPCVYISFLGGFYVLVQTAGA